MIKKTILFGLIVLLAGCSSSSPHPSEQYLRFLPLQDGTLAVSGGDAVYLDEIVIPEKHDGKLVKKIDDYGFKDFASLKSIKIPDSIEMIGYGAFQGCYSLPEITLPFVGPTLDSESTFGYAFGDSSYSITNDSIPVNLKKITISNGMTTLSRNAFCMCRKVETIVLPTTLKNISFACFAECRELKSFDVPFGVEKIEDLAFSFCYNLKEITIPNTVKEIHLRFLHSCSSLEKITFNGTVNEWNSIEKIWKTDGTEGTTTVICNDGTARLSS